jgi:opacity protein-like surface antigen
VRPVFRRSAPVLLGFATAAALLAAASRAGAFERQFHLGADGGWSAVSWRGAVHGGWGAGAHLTYGLTDAFNAMLELAATDHAVAPGRPDLVVMSGAAGVAYTLDVLRWVPYGGLLVGGYRFSGAELERPHAKLGFQVAIGLDYQLSRSWAVGGQVKYHTFSDDPLSAHYLTTFARVAYLWGW